MKPSRTIPTETTTTPQVDYYDLTKADFEDAIRIWLASKGADISGELRAYVREPRRIGGYLEPIETRTFVVARFARAALQGEGT